MTARTEEGGRLFPAFEWDNGWSMSVQADRGYQCSPKARLDRLEDYETVEVKLDGPHGRVVDPHTMGLPPEVVAKFPRITASSMPSIGAYLAWPDVEAVRQVIAMASMRPNAGVPRGVYGWSDETVYHGTSEEDAEAILENGIDTAKGDGYFGRAFYAAEDRDLARSNYAEFSGDEGGGPVLAVTILDGARILDLRNEEDAATWAASGLPGMLGSAAFAREAVRAGVDGVYDRSVGGLAIYNAGILSDPVVDIVAETSPPPNVPRR